jgi:hypothetical protein
VNPSVLREFQATEQRQLLLLRSPARRIAQQVASDAFDPTQIIAVSFTDKAGGELRARLAALWDDVCARGHVPGEFAKLL